MPRGLLHNIEPIHEHISHDDHVRMALHFPNDVELFQRHSKLGIVFAANIFESIFRLCFLVFDKEHDTVRTFSDSLNYSVLCCGLLRDIALQSFGCDEGCRCCWIVVSRTATEWLSRAAAEENKRQYAQRGQAESPSAGREVDGNGR